jgi:membrane protease YdiL (CAAX protease family)
MSAPSGSATARPTARHRLTTSLAGSPTYPPDAADRRTVSILGLEMPLRASVAIALVTIALVLDYSRTFIPEAIQDLGRAAEANRYQAIERAILFGIVPLAVVLLAFRDRPGRYGLRLGDWRAGIALGLLGCAVMTPVALALAQVPSFRDYYAVSWAPPLDLVVTHALDLVAAEFLVRGFLLFALVRVFGGAGVLIATLPFVFAHLGKPEVELFSTLFGGMVYGWVNWRTGSILYSGVAHVYIVTLLLVAVGP